jgi:hypothetical protein
MDRIPLNIQTVYADLLQQLQAASRAGSTYVQTVHGIRYLYLRRQVGAKRIDTILGREDDAEVAREVERIRVEAGLRKERRELIAMLKRWLPTPTQTLGRVVEVCAESGLFRNGAVLVGTAAYICFPALVGFALPAQSLGTQDVDVATASLALDADAFDQDGKALTFESILKLADPSFSGLPQLNPKAAAARYRASNGFIVELLTQTRSREEDIPRPLKALRAGAIPLQHMAWLIEQPVEAMCLHGAGCLVTVPRPARYAVHKLIISQKRDPGSTVKRAKDLRQAKALIEALRASAPFDLNDALDDARSQGQQGWAQPIDRALAAIGESTT